MGGGGEVGALSLSAPGALGNLRWTWIREETQLQHGVCLTVTVMSVVRLWETQPKVGEGGEKAEVQAGWSAQPYLPVNTCGNHMHTRGHRYRGCCVSPVTKLHCLCMPAQLRSPATVTAHCVAVLVLPRVPTAQLL